MEQGIALADDGVVVMTDNMAAMGCFNDDLFQAVGVGNHPDGFPFGDSLPAALCPLKDTRTRSTLAGSFFEKKALLQS